MLVRAVSIIGVEKIGLVKPGDNVARLIFDAFNADGQEFVDDDVIVVSQKIVSKAEGLLADLSRVKPSTRAKRISKRTSKDPRLIELILRDSSEVLRADRQALVVRRKNGFVCLNAGVDKSNVKGPHAYARLPKDPDSSARRIRIELEKLSGRKLGVIVADTYSRPYRVGQVEFAIGLSGIEPIVDYRGSSDLFGYSLRYKFVGLADEVAAAAELVMGQGTERTPAAVVRNLPRVKRTDEPNLSKKLMLGQQKDLFRNLV
jgi:coenzyme F420-0:L-glutamate ligase/coenzyme F420-1:gamma-L-glutamate ligase